MKKITWVLIMAMTISVNLVAHADAVEEFTFPAEYIGGDIPEVSVEATGRSTVLIAKENDNSNQSGDIDINNIVYANQTNDIYSGTVHFFISDPEYGKYLVKLGSKSGEIKSTYFYVGVDPEPGDIAMNRLRNEEQNMETDLTTWNIGYYISITADEYNSYNSMKLGFEKPTDSGSQLEYFSFPLKTDEYTEFSGEGMINLIFQVNEVPDAYKDSIAVFLSEENLNN